jgi:hypothetical protein
VIEPNAHDSRARVRHPSAGRFTKFTTAALFVLFPSLCLPYDHIPGHGPDFFPNMFSLSRIVYPEFWMLTLEARSSKLEARVYFLFTHCIVCWPCRPILPSPPPSPPPPIHYTTQDGTEADWKPDMTSPLSSLSSKRPSTKRSISLVSTAGAEQATKYQKTRNVPPIGTASSPGLTRTPNRRGRRSPRPRASCRVATAFAVPEPEAFDSSLDDLADALKMLHITTPFERLPNEVLLKIFEELAPTPVTPRGNTSLGSIGRTAQWGHSLPGAQGATGQW